MTAVPGQRTVNDHKELFDGDLSDRCADAYIQERAPNEFSTGNRSQTTKGTQGRLGRYEGLDYSCSYFFNKIVNYVLHGGPWHGIMVLPRGQRFSQWLQITTVR